jgi:hypothetical protein
MMESAMHPHRPTQRQELIESCEDRVDRADLEAQMQSEWWGSYCSPLEGYENHEVWRRILTAHMQPLPEAAD